jgi:dipeptidyl aminopeptidase/acylaminoacyl peptidase
VSIDGGTAVQATAARLQSLALSPDGKVLAGAYFDERGRRMRTGSVALTGSAITPLPIGPRALAWAPDGRLTYVESSGGVGNIWRLSAGGPPEALTHFDADQIIAFAWSHDGKRLAVARGRVVSDVVMITAR